MQKSCTQCGKTFEITDDDINFYEKVSPVFNDKKYLIPPPKLCPDCRRQRRCVWRNDFYFYKRKSDLTGENIISLYDENAPFPVYGGNDWWSDKWNANTYSQEFSFAKTFTEQFLELQSKVPRIAAVNDNGVRSTNCEYCHDFAYGKNCYFAIGGWQMEDVLFAYYNVCYLTDVMDVSYNVHHCQKSYELTRCQKIYESKYLLQCLNCRDCFFGYDLRGCKHCFCCSHLRQKSYCIYNKQYSKEEYILFIKKIRFGSYAEIQKYYQQFLKLIQSTIHPAVYQINSENSIGDGLINCREVYGFDIIKGQYAKFVENGEAVNFCYDVMNTGKPEFCLEGVTPDESWMTHFSVYCWQCKNVMYSDNCHSCEHLFGCIGLRHKKYCIFNKQYTKEEYEKLVTKIIEYMKKTKEWGEFFPVEISPFAYNETIADHYYPLNKKEVISKGWRWKDHDVKQYQSQTYQIPDSIDDVSENVCNEILSCNKCSKNFKIIKQELSFYKTMNIPIPQKCANCRHLERMNLRTPRKLWDRQCMKCGKSIKATYSPERPEIVYCEECYLKEVY